MLNNFLRALENKVKKIKRKSKSPEKKLDEIEGLYEDSIESLDEMLRWLNFYTKEPERLEYTPSNRITPEYKLTTLNKRVSEAPKIVSVPYNNFREEKQLLSGDEGRHNMKRGEKTAWLRFCDVAKEHKIFVRRMKGVFEDGLDDVKESRVKLDRQKYDKEASSQRGESVTIKDVEPNIKPEDLREELSGIIDDELSEEDESDDDDIRLMKSRQFIHYLVEYLQHKSPKDRSDYYYILKEGHPKQADIIESNVSSVYDLKNMGKKEHMISLSAKEIKYIEDRVRNNEDINENLEIYKEK